MKDEDVRAALSFDNATWNGAPLWDVQAWGGSWLDLNGDWYALSLGVRFSPAFHLGSLAALEALDEAHPLPGVDPLRLKQDTGQAYRLVVASAGLEAVAPGSSATDVGTVADRLAERLRDFLKRKGLLERHDVEARRGFRSDTLTSPVVGRLVEWRLPSEAFIVKRDGEWAEVMRGELTEGDALLADFLEELGAEKDAKNIREGGPQTPLERRWVGEERKLPAALLALVRAAWQSVKAERERAKSSRPAVVRATVADVLMPVWRRQQVLPVLDDGRVLDDKGQELGRIALVSGSMTTHEDTRKGLELFGSVTGHRLVRSLVLRSHEQQERGDPFALRVRYEGGYEGLAEELHCSSNKDRAALPFMAEAGASVVWSTPYARGLALWALAVKRGNHLRRGEVAFTLNTPLAPDYARELADEGKQSRSARIARRLVPELRLEPPTGAVRPNEAGAVWTLHRRFLLECVDRAEELAALGAIVLPLADWREFAAEVGLPALTVPKVLASWRDGESELAPALIVEPEPWHFALGPAHDLEWRFLVEQGKRRAVGRANGRLAKLAKLAEAHRGAKRTKPAE